MEVYLPVGIRNKEECASRLDRDKSPVKKSPCIRKL